MAIIKIRNAAIDLDAAEIPNIDASKITSGSIADARIPASAVSQHATSFDDNAIVNDISTLALRSATSENAIAYSTSNQFIDVFQDSSGIASHTTSSRNASEFINTQTQSYSTPAYETGNRQGAYSVSYANFGLNGAIANWIDGSNNDNTENAWYFNNIVTITSDFRIVFDLGSGNSKIYTGAKMIQHSHSSSGGVWVWEGSNDNSSYTTLSSNFTWGLNASTETVNTWSNNTAYRYIRIKGVSGQTNTGPWQLDMQFQTKTGTTVTNATGNFISNTITAPSSTSSMGAIITYQDQAGTNALNTDIVLQLSADNGSNFTTATLTALPDFATGIKMAKVNDLAVTAGTQLKYKISFANQASGSKEARIRGVSLQY